MAGDVTRQKPDREHKATLDPQCVNRYETFGVETDAFFGGLANVRFGSKRSKFTELQLRINSRSS